jgi:hypothetical protein
VGRALRSSEADEPVRREMFESAFLAAYAEGTLKSEIEAFVKAPA